MSIRLRRPPDRPREPEWDETNVATAFVPDNQQGRKLNSQLRETVAPITLAVRHDMLQEVAAVGNSSFQLTVLMVRSPGRGLDLALGLTYNSRVWHSTVDEEGARARGNVRSLASVKPSSSGLDR